MVLNTSELPREQIIKTLRKEAELLIQESEIILKKLNMEESKNGKLQG